MRDVIYYLNTKLAFFTKLRDLSFVSIIYLIIIILTWKMSKSKKAKFFNKL